MIGIEGIRYSLRNLFHRKGRSSLTILSIFIGIATIFIFVSFGLGLYGYMNDLLEGSSADKVIIQAKGVGVPGLDTTFKLEDRDLRAIEKTSGVYEVSGAIFKVVEIEFRDEKKFVFILGYDPKNPLIMDISDVEIVEGRELRSGETTKVVLGYNYKIRNKIFSKEIKLNDKIVIQGQNMRVVGFYEPVGNPQDDSNVYVVENAIEELFPNDTISYGMIVARVDPNKVDWTVENIEKKLRASRDLDKGKEDFHVQSFSSLIESYAMAMNIIIGFIILIALISVLVSAVNTANTMITSVIERTKEIGIIKAIGGKNSEVFEIFLFESSFLGFVAGVVGVLVGFGISFVGGNVLDNLGWGFLTPMFPTSLFVSLILFAVITGAISGALPAWKASKTNTVDALRYE